MGISTRTLLQRLWTTPYVPAPGERGFLSRGQTQRDQNVTVTVAVLDAAESDRVFGVPLARRGVQPVFLRIVNDSPTSVRLHLVSIDPNYYTPLEAAGVCHFSILKRLSAFGLIGWLFLPLLALLPFKLVSARRANERMDDCFRALGLHLRPIAPGDSAEGFVFTQVDVGTKVVRVSLHPTQSSAALLAAGAELEADGKSGSIKMPAAPLPAIEFSFTAAVPGIQADYLRRDLRRLGSDEPTVECDVPELARRLSAMPTTTTNSKATRQGDPVNLVVIGSFDCLLAAFAARWDESESITLATCWKTTRAFLLGSQYRYSPVSPLHLFGRSQDVALQRSRRSINERLHLRLWLTELRFRGQEVWVGQISRDIGVRLTAKTWNLTTHRIDPDVDEARDYVVEDLLQAEHVSAAGYVPGAKPCDADQPRHNLTGDSYFSDGQRAVVLLSAQRTEPQFVAWC